MQFEETRSIRAFVGRIDPGDDVIEALTLVCNANDLRAATLRLTGTLSGVELGKYDPATTSYTRTFSADGPMQIANLTGSAAMVGDRSMLQLDALLAAHGPLGAQLAFGELLRATAIDCEFVIETSLDLVVERTPDAATGRFPISAIRPIAAPATPAPTPAAPAPPRERREPETISKPAGTATSAPTPAPAVASEEVDAPSSSSSSSWADAIDASNDIKPASRREPRPISTANAREKSDDPYAGLDFDEPLLSAGDILDHPKLGECRVIKVEDDEYAHIRLSRGQIRKLALELIELRYIGDRDGKNVFKVRVGR